MFGISVHPILLALLVFEIILLFSQTILVLSRPQDIGRKRFLVLVIFFLQFTAICSILPSHELQMNFLLQTVIAYISSISLAVAYFYYIIKELELPQLKLYSIKVLAYSISFTFVFVFSITYLATNDLYLSRILFNLVPILVAFYFCIQTITFLMQKWRLLKKNNSHHGSLIIAGNVGIIFMATMPITDIFDESLDQLLNISLVCVSLIATFYAYIKSHLYQAKLEYQFLEKKGFVDNKMENGVHGKNITDCNLSARELDVALLILEGRSYKDIGEHMFLHHKTISKHGSNIFRKTNCTNKKHFIDVFSTDETTG